MKPLVAFAAAVVVCSVCFSQETTAPSIGQKAPDFALQYATKDSIFRTLIKLSEAIGRQNIILAFYPADWSGGCTKEVCTMRDDFGNLQKFNADVFAISGDYVWSHHEWA
ncbi:MAG TPA: redoxin domain-containing protein, partial [Bacteroidota bacterium]|nr:redoxin domain-containing protein [Bacteroidota bacterium]